MGLLPQQPGNHYCPSIRRLGQILQMALNLGTGLQKQQHNTELTQLSAISIHQPETG